MPYAPQAENFMPYICLAQDLPDGTVQILDLHPNTSLRNLSIDPPGQTKYVNRTTNEPISATAGGLTTGDVNGLSAYLLDRVEPITTPWTPALIVTLSANIIAAVDAGTAMDLTAVNALLDAVNGSSVLTGGVSTGVLTELLSVLAGRGYLLPTGAEKMVGGAGGSGSGGTWDAAQIGEFTTDVLVFGTVMNTGEITSEAIGGDTEARETKGIRHTYDGDEFQISLGVGHLATFTGGVTLFPDSDLVPHHRWTYQGDSDFPQVDGARVVTVYDDDGTLLA